MSSSLTWSSESLEKVREQQLAGASCLHWRGAAVSWRSLCGTVTSARSAVAGGGHLHRGSPSLAKALLPNGRCKDVN